MAASSPPEGTPGVVIIGVPRSGTTLLRRILDAHPEVTCPPESYLLSAAARFLHEDSFGQGLRIGVLSGLSFMGFEEPAVLDRLRSFVFGFFEDHAKRQGKARWAEKTAFDVFHLDAIRRIVGGHVRFLCVQRHGLDVACSLADLVEKTGGYVDELHRYMQRYPQPLEAFARAWVDATADVTTLVEQDELALDVRYEDLVRDPQSIVRGVLEFLELSWEDDLIERALSQPGQVGFGDWKTYARGSVDSSSVDRYKQLPTPTIGHLARICNPTLERLGYAPVPTTEEDLELARRRYELGLLANRMKAKK